MKTIDDLAPPSADHETSIIAALWALLAANDAQIADLKAALRECD